MRKFFAGLAALLTLVVVAQFFLAASGAFSTAPKDEAFQPHRAIGYGIVLFAVLLTVVAAIARMPGRLIGMAGLVAALAIVQGVIRAIADGVGDTGDSAKIGQFIFGLHAVNGLAIMALAGMIARQSRELSRTGASAQRIGTGGDAKASESAAKSAPATS